MLGLDTRRLLLDALRPPAQHRLDIAVGTTFTLDLTALLAVPLATALRDGRDEREDDKPENDATDALDLFETMKQTADRVVVLAQAGMTAVPARYRPLFACVENSVVPVRRPRPGRIFHPKLWALRFRTQNGDTHHRIVVLTRNLTFDRTWDVMLVSDQDESSDQAFDTSGLLDALRSAPRLVEGAEDRSRQLGLLADLTATIGGARFPLPDGASAGAFVPLGWDGTTPLWPFDDECRDALVVSPFLGGKAVERFLRSATHGKTAVARPASLDGVVETIPSKVQCLVPRPEAEPDDSDGDSSTSLRGLHAKLYVQDHRGGPYRMWLGSANLTDAAFGGNVEMLVRLEGSRAAFGTAAVLGTERRDRAGALIDLLTEYVPATDDDPSEPDDALQQVGIDIAGGGVRVTVSAAGDELWDVSLTVAVTPPAGLALDARLLTLTSSLPMVDGRAGWSGLATTSITPFVVLGLSNGTDRHEMLVRAHLDGDPGHRRSAVLASCMGSPEDFLRYVLALLGDVDLAEGEAGDAAWDRTAMGVWLDPERVLEGLLVTASRSPRRLEHLARLIRELDRTERGREVVPDDFRAVWESVWTVVSETLKPAQETS